MEKSNSQTSQKQSSRDEHDSLTDELPTTSRAENRGPELLQTMSDYKSLDFNSADEVRQAMKAVLTGHLHPQKFSENDPKNVRVFIRSNAPFETSELSKKDETRKAFQRQLQRNLFLKMNSSPRTTGNARSAGMKRRGRPMKAGPSKSVRRQKKKSALYNGKLSNVVQFKRLWASESGSDADSVFY